MKLIDYARQQGISYRTAWRWYKAGKIQGQQMDTGTILVTETVPVPDHPVSSRVAVYTRVSSAENTTNLDSQAERLVAYCAVRGYQVSKVVKEIGSGVNENRPKFLALLADPSIGRMVIEHKDRGTRFGFRYIETLLNTYGRNIEVVNKQKIAQKTCSPISRALCTRSAPGCMGSAGPNGRPRKLSRHSRLKHKARTHSQATGKG